MLPMTRSLPVMTLGLALALAGVSSAQSAKDHAAEMQHRGDEGMGFSQEKTTHHFLLRPNGGIIDVSVKDPRDAENRDRIRMHLEHIARAFGEGRFDIPMFVHDQTPPGVPVMVAKKDRIHYRFESTKNGGRVVMTTEDPDALAAIHDFLRFQIREHETGDPTTVK